MLRVRRPRRSRSRSARAEALAPRRAASATGSAPRRRGTVGSPSLTTTTSGTAFGWRSSSPRSSSRARRTRVAERRLPAERDLLQPVPRPRAARRRRQRDRRLGQAALERDQRNLVAAPGRVLEQLEDDALHLLDHPLGVHRPAVVDHEADAERRAVLADLAAEILAPRSRPATATDRTSAARSVASKREVVVARAARAGDACTFRGAGRRTTAPGARAAPAPPGRPGGGARKTARRVDAHGLDRRSAVRRRVRVER